MNQGFAGLFSVLLLLSIILIGTGAVGSQLLEAQGDIHNLKNSIALLEETVQQKDVEIQALMVRIEEEVRGREVAEGQVEQLNSHVNELNQLMTNTQAERDRLAKQVQYLADRLAQVEKELLAAQAAPDASAEATAAADETQATITLLEVMQRDPLGVTISWIVIFLSGGLVAFVTVAFRPIQPGRNRAEPSALPGEPSQKNPNGYHPEPAKGNHQADTKAVYAASKSGTRHTQEPLKLTRIEHRHRTRTGHCNENHQAPSAN